MAAASRSGSLLRDPAISRLELPWPLAGRCRGGDLLYARAGWFSASMATETDLDLDRQGRRRRDACRAGQARPFEGGRAQGVASLADPVDLCLPLGYTAVPRLARRSLGLEGTGALPRSEEHTAELQSLLRNSYAVFC